MTREFTEEEANTHNALTERGWKLLNKQLLIHESRVPRRPGWFARRRLAKAEALFEEALAIHPEGWSSMWALGKIHQRLGRHETSLEWFAKAHAIQPDQPDVAREAGLAALDCDQADLAVQYCSVAAALAPGDPGLVANLALAHLLAGDDEEALVCAQSAVEARPGDEISQKVLEIVDDVAKGRRLRPTSSKDFSW